MGQMQEKILSDLGAEDLVVVEGGFFAQFAQSLLATGPHLRVFVLLGERELDLIGFLEIPTTGYGCAEDFPRERVIFQFKCPVGKV